MNNFVTVYELLGLVKDNSNKDIYVKYFNRLTEKEDVMWGCLENLFDKLDSKIIFLNDEVEILEKDKPIIEKIKMNGESFYSEYINSWIKKENSDAYCEYLSNKLNEIIDYINRKEDN